MGKVIRALYYTKSQSDMIKHRNENESLEHTLRNMKQIQFNTWQKMMLLFSGPCSCLCKRLKRDRAYQDVFKLGSERVKNDLNMYTMLETIMKIKAAVTVLVGNNDAKLKKI